MDQATLNNIKNAYGAWHASKGASSSQFINLLDDNISWKSLTGGATGMKFTGEHKRKQEVQQYFAGLAADWAMIYYNVDRFLVDGDWVVMLGWCSWRHRRTNLVVETPKADFMQVKDGKIVKFREFFDTAQALAATRPTAKAAAKKVAKRPSPKPLPKKAKNTKKTAKKRSK